MFPGPTELPLIGHSIESIWTQKIQIKYIDTKNQLADMLTKGNFTRDEWNHLLCLFNICHFSSAVCSEVMSERTQKDSGEERVTAKSKSMMSLIARAPSTLSSSASESPGRKVMKVSVLGVRKLEKYVRTEQPVVGRDTSHASGHHHKKSVERSYSARHSGWDDDKAWSSQEWKADELMDDRTGTPVVCSRARTHEFQSRFSHEKTKHIILEEEETHDRAGTPVVCPRGGARPQQFIIGDGETELELSLGSRSFLNRVNDQVRKRQKRSSMNVTEDGEKHSVIWGMFMTVTLESAVFMVKNYSDNWHSIKNTEDLTMKQMFDISQKLITEQSDEIYGMSTINWEHSSWKYLSLVGDEQVISLQRTKVYVFSDSVLCLGKIHENPNQTLHGNKDWSDSKHLRNTETWTELTASQWNSSGICSQGSIRCSSVKKSKSYCWD